MPTEDAGSGPKLDMNLAQTLVDQNNLDGLLKNVKPAESDAQNDDKTLVDGALVARNGWSPATDPKQALEKATQIASDKANADKAAADKAKA